MSCPYGLFLGEEHLDDGLSHGLQGAFVYLFHDIIDGVPGGAEVALLAVGIVGNDVDGGDIAHLGDRHMVVGNHSAVRHGERASVADGRRRVPHLVHDGLRVLSRHPLLVELGPLSSHHVEQDAKAGLIVGLVGMVCPVAGP